MFFFWLWRRQTSTVIIQLARVRTNSRNFAAKSNLDLNFEGGVVRRVVERGGMEGGSWWSNRNCQVKDQSPRSKWGRSAPSMNNSVGNISLRSIVRGGRGGSTFPHWMASIFSRRPHTLHPWRREGAENGHWELHLEEKGHSFCPQYSRVCQYGHWRHRSTLWQQRSCHMHPYL